MASSSIGLNDALFSSRNARDLVRNRSVLYCIAAFIVLGGCALNSALGHWANQPNRDLYQHAASLRALITDLHQPANPFVASEEGSRHFHPYWVAMAMLARTFGWTVWQTIGVASFFSMGVVG